MSMNEGAGMLGDIVIDVNNISKSYKLYDKPVDRLKETLHPWKKNYHRDFFALHNISFQVSRGETVGIVGRNGAGKSTLLKIITGVLTPSTGSVTVNGKIASLLELGTGFNPEFTGIENIYLNGAFMGYTHEEMEAKLPAILEFADIGDFIHQPVKLYSSGMYVRLAFSVAINVEPDVLIVDEALAVGDARFQMKCYQRLEDICSKGTTILFVTHDLAITKKICTKAILLENGALIRMGEPKDITILYFDLLFPNNQQAAEQYAETTGMNMELETGAGQEDSEGPLAEGSFIKVEPGPDIVRTFGMGGADVDCLVIQNVKNNMVSGGEKITVDMHFRYDDPSLAKHALEQNVPDNIIVGVSVSDLQGTYLFGMTTYDKKILLEAGNRRAGRGFVRFVFAMPFFQNGEYSFNCAIALGTQENHIQLKWYDGIAMFRMQSSKKYVYGLLYQEYEVLLKDEGLDS